MTIEGTFSVGERRQHIRFPLLRYLAAQRFRSLYDIQLNLKPLNIFIGPNASGKSNLFKLLHFVRNVVIEDKWGLYDEMADHLFWYGMNETEKRRRRFTVDMQIELPEQLGDNVPEYRMVAQLVSGKFGLSEEHLHLQIAPAQEPVEFIARHNEEVRHYVERANGDRVGERTRLPMRVAALREYGRAATFPPVAALYRFIEGWRFLDVDVHAARQSAVTSKKPDRVPPLSGDAGSLSAFLQAVSAIDPDVFEEIQDRLGRAIGFPEDVQLKHQPSLTGGPGQATIAFRERAFPGRSIPPDSISDGTVRLLAQLGVLLGDTAATLICIEEPDQGLHPYLMLRLADAIRSVVDVEPDEDFAETRRPQVILTTHSPDFLDCFDPETESDYLQVFVAERALDDGKTEFKPVNGGELRHWLDEYRLGELVRMGVVR